MPRLPATALAAACVLCATRAFPRADDAATPGKDLYDAGRFKEYLARHPDGPFAPHARYCLIAGRKRYVFGRKESPRRAAVRDADREIARWPGFLKAHPDFAGADDANYRYARALEQKGRLVDACLRLARRYPDGDMRLQSTERLVFLMDARMDAAALARLRAAAARPAARGVPHLVPPAEIDLLARYFTALKAWRAGRYAEAAAGFRGVALPKAVPPSPLARAVLERAGQGHTVASRVNALARKPDGDALYRMASLIYKKDPVPLWRNLQPWRMAVSSYRDCAGPEAYCRRASKYWRAAVLYKRVLSDHPKCDAVPNAIFMLGNCYCHLADREKSLYWRRRAKANVRTAVGYYRRFLDRYPQYALAHESKVAVTFLTKKWRLDKKGD
jgi:TolA-binding protein